MQNLQCIKLWRITNAKTVYGVAPVVLKEKPQGLVHAAAT